MGAIGRPCVVCGVRTSGSSRCPQHDVKGEYQTREYRDARQQARDRDGNRCRLCGRGPHTGTRLQVDHVVPLVDGGTHDLRNLWTLCVDCHASKTAADRKARGAR